ncbi:MULTISPECIES: cryptochrome/photolyase family protein [Actibacterium]|uniref:Deoxyribodipyrimidine photo-lyase n=1 Tax=Actibacterium naphthalenivorans TaxID=1614693 RepID=A0A840CF05_9RHOB|nr:MULTISPECIES: deoxyribodipyrimidine photo-lyase [Actibacterium]ALG90829.1 deoxyribodipyrimidine photolyase [Actibacterium sp. EMB200-NS6]MBB4023870.1 deoxyribodipyrimidine photo-lyase [Actibacterium naphthalenivorans]
MTDERPILLWLRRDLRLTDHPALDAACRTGRPVIPVFIHDEVVERLGAAPKWRLGLGVERFAQALAGAGSRLICRRGPALAVLRALVAETGAGAVFWSRLYDPDSRARDTGVKAGLRAAGLTAQSFPGHLLFEPWTVATGAGGFYKVYSPFWRAVKQRDPPAPLPAPAALAGPHVWPRSDDPADWGMGAAMGRGAAIVAPHLAVGEAAARARLHDFLSEGIAGYGEARDFPARAATSRLSENLSCGEISPGTVWRAARHAFDAGAAGAETFLKQLIWREFAWHLLYHTPHMATRNWRAGWDGFPWSQEDGRPEVIAWKQGRTGVAFVDAAMRQMYVTGTMHNRARMIAASYLTKHLLTDWRVGQAWFEQCLVDWDPAANAMGWQWVAGSGPDAAPYFRIFNPDTQLRKFDPDGTYADTWLAEGRRTPHPSALRYFDAVPRRWALSPHDIYPAPVVGLAEGRARALAALANRGG